MTFELEVFAQIGIFATAAVALALVVYVGWFILSVSALKGRVDILYRRVDDKADDRMMDIVRSQASELHVRVLKIEKYGRDRGWDL